MSTLTIDDTLVRVVKAADEHQMTLPAGVAIKAGDVVHRDTSTGFWALANASDAAHVGDPYMAGQTVVANEALTAYKSPCIMDLGEALAGLTLDDPVYLSDTDETLQTTAGSVSTIVGRVIPGFAGSATPDKLLLLKL